MFSRLKTWLASIGSWLSSSRQTDRHWFYHALQTQLFLYGLTREQKNTVNQLVLFGATYSRGSGKYTMFISLVEEEKPDIVVRMELCEKKENDIYTPLMEMHVLSDGSVDEYPGDGVPVDHLLLAKMHMGARIKRD